MRFLSRGRWLACCPLAVAVCALALGVAGCTLVLSVATAWAAAPPLETQDDIFPSRLDFTVGPGGKRIEAGEEPEAVAYYDKISRQLKFRNNKPPKDLDDLLRYFDYTGLTAEHIDTLAPNLLMNRDQLKKRLNPKGMTELSALSSTDWAKAVLAARYFSPKTSDVSGKANDLSWRKVVRLEALPKSKAMRAGLDAMYFLSVVYVDTPKDDPFPANSSKTVNIQVLLTRGGKAKDVYPAYWLVFEPGAKKYALTYSTKTSWDAASPKLPRGKKDYFVPAACQQCHGGDETKAVLNFFDTDWILDKVSPGEDFERVGKSKYKALYDLGEKPIKGRPSAFEVFRRLNQKILAQNQLVDADPENPSAQTVGAYTWNELHKKSDERIPAIERGLKAPPKSAKGAVWNSKNRLDSELVPLLARYCYRCHGSVEYNVFDKEAVRAKAGGMKTRVQKGRMPMDRKLPVAAAGAKEGDRERLIRLLGELQKRNP